jgi:hypothetical protein
MGNQKHPGRVTMNAPQQLHDAGPQAISESWASLLAKVASKARELRAA